MIAHTVQSTNNLCFITDMKDLISILQDQRQELKFVDTRKLCTRKEEQSLDLNSPLAQVVIGVRRSGKSTLCMKVIKESGITFGYVNFDDEQLAKLRTEQLNDVLDAVYKVYGDVSHLFLDEVQNIPDWALFVNRLLRQGMHLLLTGSNANLLSGELATHLTGRYNQIELYPFSFAEYCVLQGVDIATQSTKANALRYKALEEYMQQGGFPELQHLSNPHTYTLSLLNAIIKKDICKRYSVRHQQTLSDLANGVLENFCQEISYKQLSEQYQLGSVHTAKQYLHYLEEAYMVRTLPLYSFKNRDRQTMRKYYAVDPAFITNHEDMLQRANFGWRLENVVAIELMRRMDSELEQLYYYKKSRLFEVDFVRVRMGKIEELVQVTYDFANPSTKQYNREIGGLVKGAQLTGCNNLRLIIMNGHPQTIEKDGYTIQCVRATDWLLHQE